MSRPLRIEYEDAWYHVMNRGTNRKLIFTTDEHRRMFLKLLEEATHLYQIEIHAYCLMDNHYHLLLCTPHANLGRAMRHINGVYTQRFNRLEKRDGPLYRGRYKAILIEEQTYLLQVSRYIHLNPVSANICSTPNDYPWSSYNNYTKPNIKQKWLITKNIIAQLGSTDEYINYVCSGNDDETKNFYLENPLPTVLATINFKNKIIPSITTQKIKETIPDIKRSMYRPSIETVKETIASFFKIHVSDLIKSQRGQKNIPRLIAIYLSRKLGLYTYSQIGQSFNCQMYAINSSLKRCEKILSQNAQLYETSEKIQKKIYGK
jgi:putative transposase